MTTTTTKTATTGADAGVRLPRKGTEPDAATVTDYCECGHAPYAHEGIVTSDKGKCLIYRCDCLNYQHHDQQPSDPDELSQHTPTPWALRDNAIISTVEYLIPPDVEDGEQGVPVTVVNLTGAMGGADGDAAHIVRCVNSHAGLVAALELAAKRLDFLTNWIQNSYGGNNADVGLGRQYAEAVREALKQARGGE